MKKFLLIIALMSVALGMNAQFYAGGTIGFGVVTAHADDESITTTTVRVNPEGGYVINDMWRVGVSLRFESQSTEGLDISQFSLMPYVRNTFAHLGKVDFFGELGMGYTRQSVEGHGNGGFIMALNPGMLLNFSEKFALVTRVSFLQYENYSGTTGFGFHINNGAEIGVQYSF